MVFGFFIARDITQRPFLSGDGQTNLGYRTATTDTAVRNAKPGKTAGKLTAEGSIC